MQIISPTHSPIRFAILGCGRMGRMHIERLIADGRGHAVALFDTQPDAVESLRRELAADATGFSDFDDLLSQTEADAAIIGSPTSLHFDHIRACRARGWHVLCEKPLADRREHLLTLIDELFDRPYITFTRASEVLGVTYRSAQLNVQKLAAAGILHELPGRKYGRIFVAKEIVGVLEAVTL